MAIQIDVVVVVIDRVHESPAFMHFVGMPIAPCFNAVPRCSGTENRVYSLVKRRAGEEVEGRWWLTNAWRNVRKFIGYGRFV